MIRHKSAIKAHKQSLKKRLRNKVTKNRVKTYIKKVENLILSKSLEASKYSVRIAESVIMKAVRKKRMKLRTASRKISNLHNKIKFLEEKENKPKVC